MNELLEKILATDVLNEDTKAEIASAFTQLVNEKVEAAKAEAEADVRAQLTEQWITERDNLIDALDAQVTELLEAEIAELKQDINDFRDLEVEYAGKLVEARKELAEQLDADITTLAEQLDEFIGIKLRVEMDELKESIEEVRRNELGRKVFEMFAREYQLSYVNKTEIETKLAESEKQQAEISKQLVESQKTIDQLTRGRKMEELLAPLAGKQREVMETILKSVPTEKLEEGYNMFLGRVLKESKQPAQENNEVLAESVKTAETVVKTGDTPKDKTVVQESVVQPLNPEIEKLRRLAGL